MNKLVVDHLMLELIFIRFDVNIMLFFFFCGRLNQLNEHVYASPNVWKIYTVSYMHYSTVGTIVGIAVGLVVSLLFPTRQSVDPKLLAPFVRPFGTSDDHKARSKSQPKTEEYALVSQDTKLWPTPPRTLWFHFNVHNKPYRINSHYIINTVHA